MNTKQNTPTRIVLSGLAGAGKSSVGTALADKLGYTYRMASKPARNEAMRIRLQKVHGSDFTDQSKYDHVIATDGKSIEELVEEILNLTT